MLVALAYCQRDQEAAIQLLEWIAELGRCQGHKLLLCHDGRCDSNIVADILSAAKSCFDEVVRDIHAKAELDGWPEGANYMFRTVATEISYQKAVKYFMWLEPDSIPLKTGWLEAIESEYLSAKKPFMGDRVEVNDVPIHQSGIGIYPNPLYDFAGEVMRSHEVAWDVAAATQIVPQAHFTKLIEHAWRHPTFTNQDELQTQIRPEAVLFHASKDGSLIKLLREQKGGDASCQSAKIDSEESTSSSTTLADISCDIFIRTYDKDFPWLKYCLQSIHKYAKNFRKIWIVSPQENPASAFMDSNFIEWKVLNEEAEDGYLSQQIHKLYADVITNYEADYILHMDSDVLFTREVTPKDFFRDEAVPYEKLIWYYTPYEHTETPWQPITEKFMGKPVANEFMRRLPMLIPKWLYPKMREYCYTMHKVILSNYVKNQPHREFSEFNALGAFAYEKFRDKFEWVNTHEQSIPANCARQFQSWDGITDEVKKEIDQILSGKPVEALSSETVKGCEDHSTTRNPSLPTTAAQTICIHDDGITILGDGLSGGNGVAGVIPSSPPSQDLTDMPENDSRGSPDRSSTRHDQSNNSPRTHINALAAYADLPWKRQYVINELKKKFKSKRKLAKQVKKQEVKYP